MNEEVTDDKVKDEEDRDEDKEVMDKEDRNERLIDEEVRNESVGTVRDEAVEVPIYNKVHYNYINEHTCKCQSSGTNKSRAIYCRSICSTAYDGVACNLLYY